MSTEPKYCEDLASIPAEGQGLYCAYAMLRRRREGRTHQGRPYVDLELADQSGVVAAKIWDDAAEARERALELRPGAAVKLLFLPGSYQGTVQLNIKNLRATSAEDEGQYSPANIFGEGIDLVQDLICQTLVFDIETVPAHDKRELPSTVAESLAKFAEYKDMETGAVMGMSPFFGQCISLALGDGEVPLHEQQVTALVVPPEGMEDEEFPEWMRPMSEPDLLRAFWTLAGVAETVVTYNGRGFDIPFLVNRSLVHGIEARVDLLSNRWSLRPHLDLLQLVRQGSSTGPSNLDVVCWALGIESPKGQMDGSMVAPAYASGKIEEIARYNLADVTATTAVYHKLRDGLLRFRKDW